MSSRTVGTTPIEAAQSIQSDEEWDMDLVDSFSSEEHDGRVATLSGEEEVEVIVKNIRDPQDLCAIPSNVQRHCTDIGGLVIYFAFSALVVYITVWVWPRGRPGALLRLPDWQGEHCGLGYNHEKPLLFFCPRWQNPKHLQIWYPVCVQSCPEEGEDLVCPMNLKHTTTTTTTTTTASEDFYHPIQSSMNGGLPYPPYPMNGAYSQYPPQQSYEYPFYRQQPAYPPMIYPPQGPEGHELSYDLPPGAAADPWHSSPGLPSWPAGRQLASGETIIFSDWRGNFTLYRTKSYPSAAFVDMVCKPWDKHLEQQVQKWIDQTPLVNTWATLINSYWPLLVTAGTGIVMSYVYITLLRFRAEMLVQTGMIILVLVPLATGVYFLWCWKSHGQCWGSTGDRLSDGLTALGGVLVGLTFMSISWHLEQDIDLAIDCIEWSCKAVLETPSLKLEPLLALAFRCLVDLFAASVVALILTSDLENDEVRHREYRWIIPPQSLLQIGQMLTIGFWCLWTNWIITAISDFVIMYTTELWAFTGGLTKRGHAPCCSILRGYFACLRYHFGTMVVGGLVVGAAQPFRLFFAVLSTLIKFDRRAVGIISLFCDCVVQVYMDYLEPWCRNAYMDVALNSYSFVQSALHVSWVNNGDFVDTVHVLNGATWLFQLAGLGAITSLGHLQVCVILKYYPGFEDPYSPAYVQNPFLLSICGSAVAFITAFPFMMIFDTVSDTILYVYLVQKMREEREETPTIYTKAWSLAEFVDDFIGLHCLDHDKKDYSMPTFLDDVEERRKQRLEERQGRNRSTASS